MLAKSYFVLPLYKDDGKPIEEISKERIDAILSVKTKLKNSVYKDLKNDCLCGNKDNSKDIVISEKDRYGFSVKFLLCKHCSIVRTDKRLDDYSLSNFYAHYYRKIYGDGLSSIQEEFDNQVKKGNSYLEALEIILDFKEISSVIDFGCGTGGVLLPFKNLKKEVYGVDFDKDRLNFGNTHNLNLMNGNEDLKKIKAKKYDLVILSHVMEHFAYPIKELNDLFELVEENGYIFIIVPSPQYIGISPIKTHRFFQNVHLYNFNQSYLKLFFKALNMEIVYLDKECQCVLKKPKNWQRKNLDYFYNSSLSSNYINVLKHFKKVRILNDILKLNYIRIFIIKTMEFLNIKTQVKKIINNLKYG